MGRPGIKPRTSDLRVRCPTDCTTTLSGEATDSVYMFAALLGGGQFITELPPIGTKSSLLWLQQHKILLTFRV